jgi:hypothetical protein
MMRKVVTFAMTRSAQDLLMNVLLRTSLRIHGRCPEIRHEWRRKRHFTK